METVVSMGAEKWIDDLVVLGRSAPEPMDDGRETVCLGGYSESEGWVRLYPTKRRMSELSRWNIVRVPVESGDSNDPRSESYKIAGSKEDWDTLHRKVEKVGRLEKGERIQLVDELAGDCTRRLRENRVSLGMVEPRDSFDPSLKPTDTETVQTDLMGNPRKSKTDYKHKLYLNYRCVDCVQKTPHEQHTIEWGVYKYWDKNEDDDGVVGALHLEDDDWKHYFFVGNMKNQLTSYIVISILRFKKDDLIRNGVLTEEQSALNKWT